MKFIFILISLFILPGHALAEQPGSPEKCMEMYLAYLNNQQIRQLNPEALLQNYIQMCKPEFVQREESRYIKLLQIIDHNQPALSFEANLTSPQSIQPDITAS